MYISCTHSGHGPSPETELKRCQTGVVQAQDLDLLYIQNTVQSAVSDADSILRFLKICVVDSSWYNT